MRAIQNAMRLQAQRALASVVSSRVGQVTNYDPTSFTVRVQLQPDSVVTGWIPVASPWIGNGWGLCAAPNIGDMVVVDFINGDLEAGIVVGRLWNLQDLPLAPPAGEFWLVHKSGQFVKLTNDGKLTLSDAHGTTVSLNGDGTVSSAGTWTHTGSMTVTGNVSVSQTLTATTDVVGGGKSLKSHTHTDPQGGATGPPV